MLPKNDERDFEWLRVAATRVQAAKEVAPVTHNDTQQLALLMEGAEERRRQLKACEANCEER